MVAASTFPPFPDNVPTHPLLVIDYALLKTRDKQEMDRLWEAATNIGFWYLKNHGVTEEVNAMFSLGEEAMKLPLEEKLRFEQGDEGSSFGYKAAGANAVDATGELDTVEFINIAKDDVFMNPSHKYPAPIEREMVTIVKPFVQKSLEVNQTILDIFNDRLGLPEGTLLEQHPLHEHSGSEARIIKNPPMPHDAHKRAIGAHTDFGSLPILGHAVCNIGDALSLFSGGILRSNLHRVLPPPGEQSTLERWSLVFFTRPGDNKILRALVESSPAIAAAVASKPEKGFETDSTARNWFARRVKYQRIANREGPESWMASRGTEADPAVA